MSVHTPYTKGAGYFVSNIGLAPSRRQEADVRTCTHCQSVILMQKWKEDGGFCGKCMAPICGLCADRMLTYGCEPFVKKLEQGMEARYRFLQFSKLAGLDTPPPGYSPAIIVGGK